MLIQIIGYITLQIPGVQTWAAKKAVSAFAKDINGNISIGKVYFIFFNKVIIKDLAITSTNKSPKLDSLKKYYGQNDTLVRCKSLSVGFSVKTLLGQKHRIKSITLDNGVFNLQSESDSTTNLDRIFNLNKETDTTKNTKKFSGYVDKLSLTNFRFKLNNPFRAVVTEQGIINFSDLDVNHINIKASNIIFEDKILHANIQQIKAVDKSGFTIKELSGNLRVGKGLVSIQNLHVKDMYSNINAEYYSMSYKQSSDFSNFTNAVVLGAYFNHTYFDFRTIGQFAPTMKQNSFGIYLTGKVIGPVCNLKTESLVGTSKSGQTYVNIDGNISGLPDTDITTMIVDIKSCATTTNDIARIVSSFSNSQPNKFISTLTPFTQYRFSGNLTGLLNDFAVSGDIKSLIGDINTDLRLYNNNANEFVMEGGLKTSELQLDKVLNNNLLGNLTMEGNASVTFMKNGNTNILIKSLNVNKLGLNNYNYSNIMAAGEFSNEKFDGRILCKDKNLNFIFQGLFSLGKHREGKYNFFANIPFANLSALNLDTRDSISEFKAMAQADFIKSLTGDIVGNINLSNLGYTNSTGDYEIGDINLKSHSSEDNSFDAVLKSNFLKAEYKGTYGFIPFAKEIYNNIVLKHTSELLATKDNTEEIKYKNNICKFSLETFNTKGICELISPGLYIEPHTKIITTIANDNSIKAEISSGGISYLKNYIKQLHVSIDNREDKITAQIKGSQAVAAGMKLNDPIFTINGIKETLITNLIFNHDTTSANSPANINAKIFFNKKTIGIDLFNTSFAIKGEKWNLKPSTIYFKDSSIAINGFELYNKMQNLSINGTVSDNKKDSLLISLKDFDISIFNALMVKSFNFKGKFSGDAKLTSLKSNPNLFLDLNGDSISINNAKIGKMKILSKWSQPMKRFNVLINSKIEGRTALNVSGYYKPDSTSLDLILSLDNFSLVYFEPFLKGIISKTNGSLSGDLRLHGPISKLNLDGENCKFNNYSFLLDYTGARYMLNGPLSIDKNGVKVKNLDIFDFSGGHGKVNGGITYNYFKDIAIDTKINFTNLQCLNLTEKQNDIFYGEAFATGAVKLKGTMNNIDIDVKIVPEKETGIHIPLSNSATAGGQTDLLTFANKNILLKEDSIDAIINGGLNKSKESTQLNITLQAEMNPNANMFIEINKEAGDIIKANGGGVINIAINPSKGIFNIFGDYVINEGSYKFVLASIASKDFTLKQGGKIDFNGPISNTKLDLTAIYKTKASINTLLSDTSSVSTRRPVDCLLNITGNLTNPSLGFNIEVPDLDPTTQMKLNNALNTEGKVQKQFIALLISGGFLPDELSGIANNSTLVFSNVSDIVSNQINNILQQLGIPLDLGVNYQQSDKGTDIFDVAVSTQLFNNRVVINGNIGNSPYSNVNSSVIGNIDVEIKIDKNGKLRLNLFSHAPDQYSNYLDNSQRSGAGLIFQQEFNKFKDIFKRSKSQEKSSRSKRNRKASQL